VRVSAKVDYAVRAAAELAQRALESEGRAPMKGEAIATAQDIPVRFLESILAELRRAGIVGSQRGADGGYWLARPPDQVSVADLIRAVEGPLADVHGTPPEELGYTGAAEALQTVWIATRAALRSVLETTTLVDIVRGELPAAVRDLAAAPDAWARR
jgi:Rrf2 family protein